MILLKLQAGLGNQMFQYAYAKALAIRSTKKYNTDIKLYLDVSWFNNINERDTKRFYGLNHFNITAQTIEPEGAKKILGIRAYSLFKLIDKMIRKVKRDIFGWSDYVYHSSAARPKKNACIEGYWWNSESYFKDAADIIRKEFTLREPLGVGASLMRDEILNIIKDGKIPILIQVRRGDYLTNVHANSFHGPMDTSYYTRATEELLNQLNKRNPSAIPHFFVVSDDINWTKEHIRPVGKDGGILPITYISQPSIKDYEEIYLMSLCHHFIISNSTFSWWGAWLSNNPDKIVIGPKQWVNDPKVDTKDVLPLDWIRL